MPDPVLHINDLTIKTRTGEMNILDRVNIVVPRGKVTGIVGESGSGKSITALSVMALLPPALKIHGGRILFYEGEKSHDLIPSKDIKMLHFRGNKISMIFQEPLSSLNPSMSCGKQIAEVLMEHTSLRSEDRKKKVYGLLEKVELPGTPAFYHSYPHQLSGGQRQRIMIAMAIAADPALIIADEPTTALDVTVQKKIVHLLKSLQQSLNISVIFISHDLRLIGEIADHVVVMRNGQIIEQGSIHQIFQQPEKAYTRGLLSCLPPLDKKPYRLLTIDEVEKGRLHYPEVKEVKSLSQQEILLSVKDLEVQFGAKKHFPGRNKRMVKALDRVDLEIRKGETLGVLGESGCGKTTLGKTILRLIDKPGGEIRYKGKPVSHLKGKELKSFRKNVQVVFQDPFASLNPRMTVRGMLTEPMKIHYPGRSQKENLIIATDLLVKTGLQEEDLGKYPHEFSGGQRQRIGIARALTTNPELIVLDESASALDVSVQAQILNLLNDLKEEFHLSYLFISHDLSIVKYMSDRIIIMREGKILETGDASIITRNPATHYTRELINAVPNPQKSK